MDPALEVLVAKEAIRELVLLYARGVDRKDVALLRDLYTDDATDSHGDSFDGPASAYCDFLERSMPYMPYSGHHTCNHLIAVDGGAGTGHGEVYAIAWHVIPDGQGGLLEDLMTVRYLDNYRRCADGRWRFARRVVTYDMRVRRPYERGDMRAVPLDLDAVATAEPSYAELTARLFQRGARG